MSPLTREELAYWPNRPADHNVRGLFAEGPQLRPTPLAALITAASVLVMAAAYGYVMSPEEAHERMEAKRRETVRQSGELRMLIALAGAKPGNSRKRKS